MSQADKENEQLIPSGEKPRSHVKKKSSKRGLFSAIFGWIKRSPLSSICILLFVFSLVFLFVIAPGLGRTAGSAIGSWEGVTQGMAKGEADGKEKGLSAEDTEAEIKTKMEQSGKLEVLLVDLRLTDLYQQGDYYAALLCLPGEGVFSVDLKKAVTSFDKQTNQITIEIPQPDLELFLDDSELAIVDGAEWKAKVFDGKTSDGYTGWLNSREEIPKQTREEMLNDADMMGQARDLAKTQVTHLAKSICGSDATITVRFIGEDE